MVFLLVKQLYLVVNVFSSRIVNVCSKGIVNVFPIESSTVLRIDLELERSYTKFFCDFASGFLVKVHTA